MLFRSDLLGILDDDWYDQGEYMGIPVIGREVDISKFGSSEFVCMTNWYPDQHDPVVIRNREKRTRQIQLLDSSGVQLARLISPRSQVSRYAKVADGVIINAFCVLDPGVEVGAHTLLYDHVILGPNSRVGRDCVMQRWAGIAGETNVGDGTYISNMSGVMKVELEIGAGTFIHPGLYLMRGTEPNEVVSLAGRDLRKIYPRIMAVSEVD